MYGDGSGGRRKCIELDCRSGVAGAAGIGVSVSTPGTTVVKVNIDGGNGVAVLVGDEHGEGLRQLRSGGGELIIAAGDGDVSGGSGNGILYEVHILQTGGTGGDSHGGDGSGQPQSGAGHAIGVGYHGRRIGHGTLVGDESNGDTGDAVLVDVLDLGVEGTGKIGTGSAGLLRPAVGNDPYRGGGGSGDGGIGGAEAGPGDGHGVVASLFRKGVGRGGVAVGVGDGWVGIE